MKAAGSWVSKHVLPAIFGALLAGCSHTPKHTAAAKPDIDVVLANHEKELLAIPGVVGVYVGVMPDHKTKCLKVMLVREDAVLQSRVPHDLEGYTVQTEVTGQIRPFR